MQGRAHNSRSVATSRVLLLLQRGWGIGSRIEQKETSVESSRPQQKKVWRFAHKALRRGLCIHDAVHTRNALVATTRAMFFKWWCGGFPKHDAKRAVWQANQAEIGVLRGGVHTGSVRWEAQQGEGVQRRYGAGLTRVLLFEQGCCGGPRVKHNVSLVEQNDPFVESNEPRQRKVWRFRLKVMQKQSAAHMDRLLCE